jgi:pimeloyl-ACP methyl ester carboxylesterase
LDLPGHGADADGDTAVVRLEECVRAIVRAVEREELKDVVLVGHGFAGGLLLQAAATLPKPPKRLVLVGAIVPISQRSMLGAMPKRVRTGFRLLAALSKLSRQSLRFPRLVIGRFLCNGMEPMEVIHSLGLFGPLPTRVLKTKLDLGDGPPPCPVTYVVLTQDKVLPPELQERMAQRLPGAEIVSVDSCHQVTLYRPRELADILLRYA